MKQAGFLVIFLTTLAPSPARAESALPPLVRDVRIEQRLNASVPLTLAFRDESGAAVQLGDYFQTKPVVLVLAYYRCPRLCNEVLNGLLDSLRALGSFDVGDQFHVVVVSFHPRETPELAATRKSHYCDTHGPPGAAAGWHFLTGTQPAIDQLTAAVGFHYAYDAKSDQFAHASGIMILTPQGRIARYFYGIQYSPRDLRLGLVEASERKIG